METRVFCIAHPNELKIVKLVLYLGTIHCQAKCPLWNAWLVFLSFGKKLSS